MCVRHKEQKDLNIILCDLKMFFFMPALDTCRRLAPRLLFSPEKQGIFRLTMAYDTECVYVFIWIICVAMSV